MLAQYLLASLVVSFSSGDPLEPGTSSPTYKWRDHATGETLVCNQCAPGNYLIKHCTKYSQSVCGPCPESHYTEIWNYIERCRYCNRFCTNDEIESVQCTQLHNRQCECKDGFYSKYGSCLRHSTCPPGQGVIANGTTHADVKCQPCAEGFFSNEWSSSKACQSSSVCPPDRTTIPGNEMNDVYCSSCKKESRTVEDQAVCDGELLKFLDMQVLTPRKQKRLVSILRRHAGRNADQEKPKPFAIHMLEILERQRLFHLRRKVIKWFPHEL
ncbi:hypothetical protein DPEC_G00007180 [Dallia pectoralis]|uniref:Uncharacterized protein n=1 Tax=Dallia pectoralis TaxID=75939 RepID=A0ACC2HL97_DALPE|nr:hypothetical protein DPEC_G00007180 [Dallia pectoralis]